MEKNFYNQAIDSDIKGYEKMRKINSRTSGVDYTTVCLLDYDYIKNHSRLIAVNLSRKEELDADPEGIQPIEFVGKLKKLDTNFNATDADNDQSWFVLTILEKKRKKKTVLKFSQENVTVL